MTRQQLHHCLSVDYRIHVRLLYLPQSRIIVQRISGGSPWDKGDSQLLIYKAEVFLLFLSQSLGLCCDTDESFPLLLRRTTHRGEIEYVRANDEKIHMPAWTRQCSSGWADTDLSVVLRFNRTSAKGIADTPPCLSGFF